MKIVNFEGHDTNIFTMDGILAKDSYAELPVLGHKGIEGGDFHQSVKTGEYPGSSKATSHRAAFSLATLKVTSHRAVMARPRGACGTPVVHISERNS